jgi:hypothetical protein
VVLATWVTIALTTGVLVAGLITAVHDRLPMSAIDEPTHLDYAFAVHDGDVPFRGKVYSRGVIDEWSCGLGHEAGALPLPCGSPKVNANILPTGKYSTAYIHYPTYFVAADLWRRGFQAVFGEDSNPLTVLRVFSVICLLAGFVVGLIMSRAVLGFRGARLVAAAFIPITSSIVLYLGTKVNPSSTATLSGVLIAVAGIRWVATGRGFGLLIAASVAAAVTAITNSLPVGVFVLLVALALVAKRFGWRIAGPWEPRWTHLGALVAVLVVPIVLWGVFISARATVDNKAVYGGSRDVSVAISGSVQEFSNLHSPWYDNDSAGATAVGLTGRPIVSEDSTILRSLRAAAAGLQGWIGLLIFGALSLIVLGVIMLRLIRTSDRPIRLSSTTEVVESFDDLPTAGLGGAPSSDEDAEGTSSRTQVRCRELRPLYMLAACAIAGVILYPPALYLSNALNFGGRSGIVSRYSTSFMPLLTYLVLLLVPGRLLPRALAVIGVVTVVGISVSWF